MNTSSLILVDRTSWRVSAVMFGLTSVCLVFGLPVMSQSSGQSERSVAPSPVPAWAKSAIWYQIFPERFRNGDLGNDPTPKDIEGSWPHESTQGWKVSPWTSDWYELQDWERSDGKPFYFHVQQRRYGGDLQGVIQKLDYIQGLGINAIYFNPLFESPSLHKYDATLYHHIDNNFGPDPEGDRRLWATEQPDDPRTWKWSSADSLFLRLIQECHRRKIRVIIDGVFNHVGMTFWAFQDVRSKGKDSRYRDWFTIKTYDDPATTTNEFAYEGWMGVRELPELVEDDRGLIPPIREHVRAVVHRWMDPNGDGNPADGIDGWRLDVAEKVRPAFWKEFRRWVRSINPEAYIVGEVWWEDWNAGKMFDPSPWLQGDIFDAVMNYRWASETVKYFAGNKSKISGTEFVKRLKNIQKDIPDEVNYALLNLFDSHDTDRLGSRVVNRDLSFDQHVGLADNRSYDIRKPNENEWRIVRSMLLFQMTFIGAPCVYAGDEAGMWGGDDPDCRKPVVWDDMTFAHERMHPFGGSRPNDINAHQPDLYAWYARVAAYRQTHSALTGGSIDFVNVDDARNTLGYLRRSGGDAVLVFFNIGDDRQSITVDVPVDLAQATWVRGVGAGSFNVAGGKITISLDARTGTALHAEGQ